MACPSTISQIKDTDEKHAKNGLSRRSTGAVFQLRYRKLFKKIPLNLSAKNTQRETLGLKNHFPNLKTLKKKQR